MSAMRTSYEVKEAFESEGCTVLVHDCGHSFRAGGEIYILAPGLDFNSNEGLSFTEADFKAFDPSGYDGRGRKYSVHLVTPGNMVSCSKCDFYQTPECERFMAFYHNKNDSCARYFWHKEYAKKPKGDFESAFAILKQLKSQS